MANILFKRGSQSALNSLIENKKGIDGAFYLTEDTHRLYAGIQNTDNTVDIVDLNKYIRSFITLNDLKANWKNPELGDFAYISEGNILATYTTLDSGEKTWIQINPDTNTNTIISEAAFSKDTSASDKIIWTLNLTQTDKDGAVITDEDGKPVYITAQFELNESDITSLVTDVSVGVDATVAENIATISANGTGANTNETVKIAGANGVSIDTSNTSADITIKGTTYELKAETSESNGQISLTDSNEKTTTVDLNGDNWIGISSSETDDSISIVHKDPGTGSDVTATSSGESGIIDKTAPKFTAVVGVQADAKGHITGVKTTEFIVPDSNFSLDVTEGDIDGDEETTNDVYTTQIHLKNSSGANIGTANIKTAHKITVDGTERIVNNGDDLGSFYSASKIDSKLTAIDAMVYRGTVGSVEELDQKVEDGVSIGDTFKASTDITLSDGTTVVAGDILIANVKADATENADGKIDAEDIVWDHITTGADTDTTYTLSGEADTINLTASTGGSAGSISTAGDDYIDVDVTGNKLTVSHKTIVGDDSQSISADVANRQLTVVTEVRRNDAGHVTGVDTTTYTLPNMEEKLLLDKDVPGFSLANYADNAKQTVNVEGGEKLTAKGALNDAGTTLTITVDHDKLSTPAVDTPTADSEVTLDGNGSIQALTDVTIDDYGHVTGYQSTTFKLPEEHTYTLDIEADSSNQASISLIDQNDDTNTVLLTSENLTFTTAANATNPAVNINFVWGTFEA